tara:strand:+ start:488 stop:661 length:174 start_codon:yes stop_codon:yes gene_type:complete
MLLRPPPVGSGLSVELGIDNMEATANTITEPSSIALAMGVTFLWHRIWCIDDESSPG